jgi:hypothetical protein
MKVGHKARRGRRRRPVPYKSHHRPTAYSRAGRRLKARMAELFAPRISDFEAELTASQDARPLSSAITSRASAAETAPPLTRK